MLALSVLLGFRRGCGVCHLTIRVNVRTFIAMGIFGTKKDEMTRAEHRRDGVVARAAEAGARSDGRSTAEVVSQRRFFALVGLVVVAGILMVAFVRNDRQYEHPTVLDSWQNAYGVFDCQSETWLAPFASSSNPDGIRSRGDSIIYIEPASDAVAGDNATLEVFLEAMDVELTDDTLRLPDGTELNEAGTFCDGEEAVLQVRRWNADGELADIRFTDLAETNFLNDLDTFLIAFAPMNSGIPIPPASADLPEPGIPVLASSPEE